MDITDFVKELNSVINSEAPTTNTQDSQMSLTTPVQTESVNTQPTKQIKVMVVSTHINQANGYSKVVLNIIKQLALHNWIKVTHFGTQKITTGDIGRTYPSNVKVIDGTALEKQKTMGFAFSEISGTIASEKPDVVFIYNDISIVCNYVEEIRKAFQTRSFKIWAYVDMVYDAPPHSLLDIINRDVERVFTFSQYWKDQLKLNGITRPVDVMNHAVDPLINRFIPRNLARQNLGLPSDVFIFTSLNRNTPRKRLDILITAFVKLIVRFPMKSLFLLIVGDKGDRGGFPLFEIFARELKLASANTDTFGNRLLITSANTSYKDEDINMLYNCGDVGVSCAEGEGFGLCTFEQMSVGVPQIVPNVNGYTEYCNDQNSLLINPKYKSYIPQSYNTVTGEAHIVDPEDVAKAMEEYVFDDELRKLHGARGKETTLKYTWEKCCSTLVRRLKSLQEDDE